MILLETVADQHNAKLAKQIRGFRYSLSALPSRSRQFTWHRQNPFNR